MMMKRETERLQITTRRNDDMKDNRQTTAAKDREAAGLMIHMLMPGGLQQLAEDIAAAEREISDEVIDELYRKHKAEKAPH